MTKTSRPTLARPTAKAPKAKADQLTIEKWEDALLTEAHRNFPAVLWWHGYRKIGDWLGSYCYICEGMIVTFTTAYPLPQAAKDAIEKHKHQHHAGKRPTLARITN